MRIKLKYGSGELGLTLPAQQVMGIYRPREVSRVRDPGQAVRKSLSGPVGSKRLSQIVRAHHKVVIVVDDATRDVPNRELLLPIVDELSSAGVKDKDICILVATGLHRKLKRAELEAVLGRLKGRIRIFNHDPGKNLKFLGETSLGTRVYLNKRFMEADVKILTGDIEFHQFVGYGGGAKSVFPGLGDRKSIEAGHARMDWKGAEAGRRKGNPVREEIDEVGRKAGVDFIVNVVLNSRREVVDVFSGDMLKAFREGTKLCDRMYKVKVPRRADTVIASAGGYPKDIDLYQAQKAVESAKRVVRRGGKIILLAECREGHGSPLFRRWMREAENIDDIFPRIKKKFVMGGHKAYQFAREIKWADIYLLSSLAPELVRDLFMRPLSAVDEIYGLLKEKDRIAVLPQATLILTKLKTT